MQPVNRFSWHRDILNRYMEHRLSLHIHVVGQFGDICFEAKAQEIDACCLSGRQVESVALVDGNRSTDDVAYRQDRQLMFIVINETIEPSKSLIPSVLRLRQLDLINRRCGTGEFQTFRKASDFPVVFAVGGTGADRPGCTLPFLRRIGVEGRVVEVFDGELPNDVIQNGTTVREAITDDRAQSDRWLDIDNWSDGIQIKIFLGHEIPRLVLQIHSDFGFKGVQMLVSPDDFEPSTI